MQVFLFKFTFLWYTKHVVAKLDHKSSFKGIRLPQNRQTLLKLLLTYVSSNEYLLTITPNYSSITMMNKIGWGLVSQI